MQEHRLHPFIVYQMHQQTLEAFERALAAPHDGPTVVVSHHAPTFEALRLYGVNDESFKPERWVARFRDESSDLPRIASYASDLDAWLEDHGEAIDLWLFGHLHKAMDFAHLGTRFVCNPRGYWSAPLTADSARTFQLLGYSFTQKDIERSQAAHAEDPYRGDGFDFERSLVLDPCAGLAPALVPKVEEALEQVQELRAELFELAPYVEQGDRVIRRSCQEALIARYDELRNVLRPVARHAFEALSPVDQSLWHIQSLGTLDLSALSENLIWRFDDERDPTDPFYRPAAQTAAGLLKDVERFAPGLKRLPHLAQEVHGDLRDMLGRAAADLRESGWQVEVSGWVSRAYVRRFPRHQTACLTLSHPQGLPSQAFVRQVSDQLQRACRQRWPGLMVWIEVRAEEDLSCHGSVDCSEVGAAEKWAPQFLVDMASPKRSARLPANPDADFDF